MHLSDLESDFFPRVLLTALPSNAYNSIPRLFTQIQHTVEIKDLFSLFPRDAFQNLFSSRLIHVLNFKLSAWF